MESKWESSIREKDSDTSADLTFQTLDWYCEDLVNDTTTFMEYKIFVFGINNSGSPVSLRINELLLSYISLIFYC